MNGFSLFGFEAMEERRAVSDRTTINNLLARFALILGLVLTPVAGLHADAPATSVTIRYTGTDFEGRQTFQLQWAAISNANYVVQQLNSLSPGEKWVPIDTVVPADNVGSYQFSVSATDSVGQPSPSRFFRLGLPQPEIFSVEPAMFAPGVAVDATLLGQCFETNDVVTVDGVILGSVNYVGTWSAQCTIPPQSPGPHLVELSRAGRTWSSFKINCEDALANPELVLQGPPLAPPASPTAREARMPFGPTIGGGEALNVKPGGPVRRDENDKDCGGGTWERKVNAHAGEQCDNGSGNNADSIFSGEVSQQVCDLVIAGRGLDFVWARTYHSRIGRTGASSNGWTFSYDLNIQPLGGDIKIHDGTGRVDTFRPDTNGIYTCPEFFSEGTFTGGVFRLTFADTGYWEFNPLIGSPTDGKLAKIIDRNGNTMSLSYDGSGLLTQIVDDLDRTNAIAYDTSGRVAGVTDFSGRTVTYHYYRGLPGEQGGAGDLASVTSPPVIGTPNGNDFPSGKTTSYTYSTGYLDDRENHLLLSVIDANGQHVRDHVYQHNQTDLEFLRCVSVQRWTNTPTVLAYLPQTATFSNQFAVLRCIINDPEGNVTEEFYDARNRCVMERKFTGRSAPGVRVTDTANRPTGKLRSDDPDYYETQWAWNNDSLCTRLVLDNHQIQCIYESDFDKSARARKRADLRVVRELPAGGGVDVDGDGTPDLTARAWSFQYDPRFGTDPSAARGKKLYVGNLPFADSVAAEGTVRWHQATPGAADLRSTGWEKVDNTGSVTESANSVINNMRTRINDLEARLINIGLLASSRTTVKRFGIGDTSPESPLGRIRPRGWDGTIKGYSDAKIITDRDSGRSKGFGFVISATDPRGVLSTGNYDTNGNLLRAALYSRKGGAVIACDFNYKEHSRLAAITNAPDANGYRRVDRFDYYTNGPQAGYLSSIAIDESGVHLTTTFEYDVRGNLARIVDPRTNDCLFTWNALDQCVRMQTPTNINTRCATDYFYDVNDNLVQCSTELRDAADNLAGVRVDRASYDSLHRLAETALAVDAMHALTNRFVYNGNDQCVLALGGDAVSGADPHQTIAYDYDERSLLFREMAAPGTGLAGTNEYGYTATYHPATKKYVDDSDSLKTSYAYDGFDRLASVEDPMGNQTTFNRDANDNVKVIRRFGQNNDVPGTNGNLRLADSRYEYDDLDRCVQSHDLFFDLATQSPIGDGERTTTFAYAPNGQCTSVTDDLGRVTTLAYDTIGRLSTMTAPAGKTVYARFFDPAGNVTRTLQTDLPDSGGLPQVFSRTNIYDSLNRRTGTTDNVGNTITCAYDSLGRVVRVTDARGIQSLYQCDLLGRQTLAVRDMDGDGIPDLAHDISSSCVWSSSSDQLLASTDSHGNTTYYGYDSLNRCTSVTNADNTRMGLVWSPRSNLLSEQAPNGTVVMHTYDLNNRCISNNIAPGAGVASTTTFETFAYDGCSRLVAATNDVSENEFVYDSLDNCTRGVSGGLGALVSPHDSLGNRLSVTYPGGRILTYAYDALDQCTNIMESGASIASFSYAGPDRVARINYGNGTRAQVTYDGLDGTANASGDFGLGEISSITHGAVGGSPKIAAVNLKWDPNGNKSARTDTIFAPAIPRTNDLALAYDAADQLTQAALYSGSTLQRDTIYGLDLTGNRTNVTGAATCSGDYFMDGTVAGPRDYQMNQYTTTPCDSRSYDDDGNLVNRGSAAGPVTYQYDYADRLVQLQAVDFSSGALVITTSTYAYDALGRRISKTVSSGGLPPVTTEFVYDGGSVIEERENGAVAATFVLDGTHSHDDEVVKTFNWTQVSGPFKFTSLFKQKTGTLLQFRRGGHDYYFHTDDQGNVLALTDSTGAAVERYDFDDYGAVAFLADDGTPTGARSSSVGNPYCWNGLRLDSESGLQNNDGGSYLETSSGRYLLRAGVPLRFDPAGCNIAGNNPWSDGGGSPAGMQKGTVKFFNVAKGFGRVAGGGGDDGGGGGGGGGGGVFAIEPREILKTFFETGDIPTQDQRILPRNILKGFFSPGDRPTQSQFGTLIDSMVNRIDDRYLLGLRASTREKTMTLKGQKILQN